MSDNFSALHNALSLQAAGGQQVFTLQGLDADALASILASINLQSESAQSAADPSHESIPSADGLAQNSPSQTLSSEGKAVPGQDMLVDCPLPFQDSVPTAATRTPARARRSKREAIDDRSDDEARVRTPVLHVHFLCCMNTASL
jgi:hypothetical protein